MRYMGRSSDGGWQTEGMSKVKDILHGACYDCGKTGHQSRDCPSERNKGKGEQKGKKYTLRASTTAATRVEGKFVNVPQHSQRIRTLEKEIDS